MNQEKKQNNDESLFPVFRFDLDNRLTYANVPALPLMKYWNCTINERIPAEVISQYPELFHAVLSHKPSDLVVEYKDHFIKFSIVPFPEANYIGMYAYAIEANEKFVRTKTDSTVRAMSSK